MRKDGLGWPVWSFIIGGAVLLYKFIRDEGKAEGIKEGYRQCQMEHEK